MGGPAGQAVTGSIPFSRPCRRPPEPDGAALEQFNGGETLKFAKICRFNFRSSDGQENGCTSQQYAVRFRQRAGCFTFARAGAGGFQVVVPFIADGLRGYFAYFTA